MITPNHLDILIHCYVAFSRPHDRIDAPAVKEHIGFFLENGIIEECGNKCYKTTEKGKFWLDAILSTPLPILSWSIPSE